MERFFDDSRSPFAQATEVHVATVVHAIHHCTRSFAIHDEVGQWRIRRTLMRTICRIRLASGQGRWGVRACCNVATAIQHAGDIPINPLHIQYVPGIRHVSFRLVGFSLLPFRANAQPLLDRDGSPVPGRGRTGKRQPYCLWMSPQRMPWT